MHPIAYGWLLPAHAPIYGADGDHSGAQAPPSRARSDLWWARAGNATNLAHRIWMAASRANSNLWLARATMSVEYNQIASVMAPSRTQLRYMVECGQRPEPALSRPACVAVNMARAKNT